MGIFDRWLSGKKPSGNAGAAGTVSIPEGHKVVVLHAGAKANAGVTPAGTCLIDVGRLPAADPDRLVRVFKEIEGGLRRPLSQVRWTLSSCTVEEILQRNVETRLGQPPILLILQRGGLSDWQSGGFSDRTGHVARLKELLRLLDGVREAAAERLLTVVVKDGWRCADAAATLIQNLGLPVLHPRSDGVVWVEVECPDGPPIVGMAGPQRKPQPDGRLSQLYREYANTHGAEDAARIDARIESLIAEVLEREGGEEKPPPWIRNERIRKALWQVAEHHTAAAHRMLHEALLETDVLVIASTGRSGEIKAGEEIPFLAVSDPRVGPGLCAFSDVEAARPAESEKYKLDLIRPEELFAIAANLGWQLFLNSKGPDYASISRDHLAQLAQGRLP